MPTLTLKDIQRTNLNAGSEDLKTAGTLFDRAFKQFGSAATDVGANKAAEFEAGSAANTRTLQNELRALNQLGDVPTQAAFLDQATARFGNQFDQGAVNTQAGGVGDRINTDITKQFNLDQTRQGQQFTEQDQATNFAIANATTREEVEALRSQIDPTSPNAASQVQALNNRIGAIDTARTGTLERDVLERGETSRTALANLDNANLSDTSVSALDKANSLRTSINNLVGTGQITPEAGEARFRSLAKINNFGTGSQVDEYLATVLKPDGSLPGQAEVVQGLRAAGVDVPSGELGGFIKNFKTTSGVDLIESAKARDAAAKKELATFKEKANFKSDLAFDKPGAMTEALAYFSDTDFWPGDDAAQQAGVAINEAITGSGRFTTPFTNKEIITAAFAAKDDSDRFDFAGFRNALEAQGTVRLEKERKANEDLLTKATARINANSPNNNVAAPSNTDIIRQLQQGNLPIKITP